MVKYLQVEGRTVIAWGRRRKDGLLYHGTEFQFSKGVITIIKVLSLWKWEAEFHPQNLGKESQV